MKDTEREKAQQEFMKILSDYWKKNSHYRFGQMMINLGMMQDNVETWSIEDEKWLKHIKLVTKK